ncbi:hypothetical protein BDW75DRAFT_157186 [Aspergillus navahoensis]
MEGRVRCSIINGLFIAMAMTVRWLYCFRCNNAAEECDSTEYSMTIALYGCLLARIFGDCLAAYKGTSHISTP